MGYEHTVTRGNAGSGPGPGDEKRRTALPNDKLVSELKKALDPTSSLEIGVHMPRKSDSKPRRL